jgi:hypothetical protein
MNKGQLLAYKRKKLPYTGLCVAVSVKADLRLQVFTHQWSAAAGLLYE